MNDNKLLKLVYTFFVGLLLAIFVGSGIAAFYPEPTAPTVPDIGYVAKEGLTPQQQQLQAAFDKKRENFDKTTLAAYNQNVSLITLVAAIIFLAISIVFERNMKLLSDGVMLGGLFTLVYSIGRGFASENSKYVFVIVSVGLAVVLYLGYHRFVAVRGPESTTKVKA